jgi:aminocarboxymuconate-semialdehyde decarboxylase
MAAARRKTAKAKPAAKKAKAKRPPAVTAKDKTQARRAAKKKSVAKNKAAPKKTARAPRIVSLDVHTHISIPDAAQLQRALQSEEETQKAARYAQATARDKGVINPSAREDTNDPVLRVKRMDEAGIDIQLVSMNTNPPYYSLSGEDGLKVAKLANEGIRDYLRHAPDRFVGLGMAPMQSAPHAVEALEHAMSLGLKGINILTNIAGHDLGEEQFWPVWKRAEELDAAVLLHPLGFTNQDRFMKFRLANTVGQPLEETLAMLSLIHEGVMARHPKLKILMSHGGGYLPFYYGRSDSTFYRDPHLRGAIDRKPSDYIRQFYLDTCVFDLHMIEFLADTYDMEHVVLGTDFPYRDWGAVKMIKSSKKLGDEEKSRILGRNAAKVLGMTI